MKVLVINAGSSSLKYQLIDMDGEKVLARGLVERIGIDGSRLKAEGPAGQKKVFEVEMKNHKDALSVVLKALQDTELDGLKDLKEIGAVGHRVVHGGENYSKSVLIDDTVLAAIGECSALAPLHNPPNITGIKAIQELLPGVKNVAVFDTAFHQTMPPSAYLYALPYEYYENDKVRKYGFHGTSHMYVANRAAEMMGRPIEELKMITCHLGNGASVTAIDGGKSVETSMGFTPLEGLVMGTRCGDVDPQIVTYLMQRHGMDLEQMNSLMNKKSGVLGLSGVSSDFRDIETAADEGNRRAQIALDVYHAMVKKYIGAYVAILGGLDAIVFTAGLGENGITSRQHICDGLEYLGISVDPELNKTRGEEKMISKADARVKAFVIPTNEELVIARDTINLV